LPILTVSNFSVELILPENLQRLSLGIIIYT
jgi:hypothetical protein